MIVLEIKINQNFLKKSLLLSLNNFITEIPLTILAAWAKKNSHLCFSKKARDGESWLGGLYWEEGSAMKSDAVFVGNQFQ